jgi:phage terminase large subunit
MEITLPYQYEPRPYQLPVLQALDSGYNRIIQRWHRRCGKDKTDINIIGKKHVERVGGYYYFFPTYKQGKKILWEGIDKDGFRFIHHFPKQLIESIDNTEMKIRFVNGSLFQIIGIENIDSVVGTNPVGCVFSEYSLQNPKGWDFIRPILAENGGWAIFNWTPRGKNHAYDLEEMAKADPEHWFIHVLTVDDTKIISPEVLEQERREIIAKHGDDALFRQEYYCSYTAAIMGAYYAKQYEEAERAGRFTNVPYDSALPVHTVWDLGIDDAMAVGFYQAVGLERRKIDYLEVTGQGLPQVIKAIKEKPYIYGKHFAPHDIKVRELGTGKSRLEVAESLGIKFELVPNISVQDGIEAGRRFFLKLWVDKTNCKDWLRAIPQYTKEYDEDKHIFKDKPRHDWTSHGADEHRYAALVEDQMTNEEPKDYNQPEPEPASLYGG